MQRVNNRPRIVVGIFSRDFRRLGARGRRRPLNRSETEFRRFRWRCGGSRAHEIRPVTRSALRNNLIPSPRPRINPSSTPPRRAASSRSRELSERRKKRDKTRRSRITSTREPPYLDHPPSARRAASLRFPVTDTALSSSRSSRVFVLSGQLECLMHRLRPIISLYARREPRYAVSPARVRFCPTEYSPTLSLVNWDVRLSASF